MPIAAALLAGCALRQPPAAAPDLRTAAYSVGGQPIDVFACGRGPGGVLVLGGVHGDERGSAQLVRTLAERLRCPHDEPIMIVPTLNPDGIEAATRSNARGVDLNRNMAARSWTPRPVHGPEPLSEPESRALDDLLRAVRPVLTISVHEGDAALVDWDGPPSRAASMLAACTGLPLQRIGARPGSLGALLGADWGWPLVTIELPRTTSQLPAETAWDYYGHCLLEAIADRG
ncbi:MAG: DUF2817 domain-containing protein [bacterium]|nr:DUF2817 domain-containing protein [bacterium]